MPKPGGLGTKTKMSVPGINGPQTVSVVICAYNEQSTLPKVLEKLRGIDYIDEIVVVNNGSVDNTAQVILTAQKSDPRIKLYSREKNVGLGDGFRLAINMSTGDIVARQDADLEYDPAELINLVEQIANGNADVVYGSRMLVRKAHKVHYYYSYLANIFITHFSNLMTNLFLSDVETGSKAFRGDVIRAVPLKSDSFDIENEITVKLQYCGCVFYEVPISYYGRKFSEGKKIRAFDGVRAIYYTVYHWLGCRLSGASLRASMQSVMAKCS